MKSAKCVHCGLINWADAEACKRCGKAPQPPAPGESGGWEPGPGFGRAAGASFAEGSSDAPGASYAPGLGHAPYAVPKKRTGLAVASLIVGLLSLPTFGLLLVGAVAAFIMGVVALTRAGRQPELYGGRGLAIGGIITSVLSLPIAAVLAVVAAVAIPNIVAAARSANEASAIHSVREILLAEYQYSQTEGDGAYGTWQELVGAGLIKGPLAPGATNGYGFELTVNEETCVVRATPLSYGRSGARSFYAECGDTEVHYADRRGADATATDPVLREQTAGRKTLREE